MKRLSILSLLLLLTTLGMARNKANEDKGTSQKDIYMFGVAYNYMDSITYVTNVDHIANAFFDNNTGYIDGIDLYTNQLETHLLQQGHAGYICTTFYAAKRKKAEKEFLKIKKKLYKKKYTQVLPLGDFSYQFISTENIYRNYVKPKQGDDDTQDPHTDQ